MKKYLVALAAAAALLFTAAPAQAHYPDWWTSYNRTAQHCPWNCWYWTSNIYGEHSRVFHWKWYATNNPNVVCNRYMYIGHSYEIWSILHSC